MSDDQDPRLEIDRRYYTSMADLGFDESQANSFAAIVQECWRRDGMFGSAVGGVTGAAIGGTVTLGTLTIPGWVLGIVVGGVVGEVKCAAKPVSAMFGHEKERLKNEIDRVLNFRFLTEEFGR